MGHTEVLKSWGTIIDF